MPLVPPKGSSRHSGAEFLALRHHRERSQEEPSVHVRRVLPGMKTGNCKGISDNKKRDRTFQKGSRISNQLQQLRQGAELTENLQASMGLWGWGKHAKSGCLLWDPERRCGQAGGSPDIAPAGEGSPIQLPPKSLWRNEGFPLGRRSIRGHLGQTGLSLSPSSSSYPCRALLLAEPHFSPPVKWNGLPWWLRQ